MKSGLDSIIQSKGVADGPAWYEKKKQTNAIKFECENYDVEYALN